MNDEKYNLIHKKGFCKEDIIEELISDYGEDIKRLIYMYVKNWTQADDLVQDVFVTVYQKLDTYQGSSSIKSWMYSIAVNKCKDFLKSWYRRNIFNTNISTILFAGKEENTPEDIFFQKEGQVLLFQSVLSLPIKYREVLILYYYKELSVVDISLIFQTKPATVKTRLRRAREKLKIVLIKKGRDQIEQIAQRT